MIEVDGDDVFPFADVLENSTGIINKKVGGTKTQAKHTVIGIQCHGTARM